jgi:PadR family transcriptional regulator PadR
MRKKDTPNPIRSGTPASMRDSLKKATTEMLVLFVLRFRPMYTYEMMSEIERLSGGVLSFKAIYQAIYRLQEFRYILESNKTVSEDNRVRVYFSITDEGRVYLEKLIDEYRCVTGAIDRILALDDLTTPSKGEGERT